jgi:hypothetical protein
MSTPSNLYAEKIYAEHPIALWTMDDKVDYISSITETNRDLSNWYIQDHPYSGGKIFTATNYTNSVNQPFPNSKTTKISRIYDYPSGGYLYDTNTISLDGKPISIGFWIYAGDPNSVTFNPNISSIDIGYKIGGTFVSKNIIPNLIDGWVFVSAEFASTTVSSSAVIYIAFNFSNYAVDSYLINGLSVGRYAQEFNKTSLGINKDKIIDISSFGAYSNSAPYNLYTDLINYGIKTDSYGFSNAPAYYIYDSATSLLNAKINMAPLVYGSTNSTMLSGTSKTAMLFPSFGFLTESGKYNAYTFETWIKINNEAWAANTTYQNAEIKLIGPVSTNGSTVDNRDGLYIVGSSILFKLGNKKASYFMGYHNRVILLHIIYRKSYVKVLINGEIVIDLLLEKSDLDLITSTKDWIYFGSVVQAQIDCVAIYNYELSQNQAKTHYIYGQSVRYPEELNVKYGGQTVSTEYAFAGYTNNLKFPEMTKWETGQFENVVVKNNILKFPDYAVPDIIFDNKDSSTWYSANSVSTDFGVNINLRPDSDWSSTNGYVYFDSMNFTESSIRGFYALIQNTSTANEQILFKFVNKDTLNYFMITINGNTIYYKFKYNSLSEQTIASHALLYTTFYYSPPTVNYALVGIDIDKFANAYTSDILSFFSSPEQISIYVGGDDSFAKTFTQPIESINFVSRNCIDNDFFGAQGNRFKLYNYVNVNGIFNISTQAGYTDISSYGINPTYRLNFDYTNKSFNIACGGFWQTNVPLSYFGKNVRSATGEQEFVLDFIQYNVDSPKSLNYVSLIDQIVDDKLTTVKSFINFQKLNEGISKKNSDFPYVIGYGGIPINGVIQPVSSSSTVDYSLNMYQIADDTIIYPPVTGNITAPNFTELALTTYLQFDTKSIFTNPAKVRYLELASQSLNTDTTLPNPIKTKFGTEIIPYTSTTSGGVESFNYKNKNPFLITKKSNGYLDLDRQSGICLVGFKNYNNYWSDSYSAAYSRGLMIKINENQNTTFNLDSIQISINPENNYQLDSSGSPMIGFSTTAYAQKIFEIGAKNKTISFYLSSYYDNDTANQYVGKIYSVDSTTGNIDENISYYWNGASVKNPYMYSNKWGILGINFTQPLSFSGMTGSFRIVGPVTVNDFSYYQYSDSKLSQSYIARPWSNLTTTKWSTWSTLYTWNDLLKISNPAVPATNLLNLYNIYTGSNRYVTEFDGTKLFAVQTGINNFVSNTEKLTGILSPV